MLLLITTLIYYVIAVYSFSFLIILTMQEAIMHLVNYWDTKQENGLKTDCLSSTAKRVYSLQIKK